MNISFEHPYAFFAILILVPIWIYSLVQLSKILRLFPIDSESSDAEAVYAVKRFKRSKFVKLSFFSLAWSFLVTAYVGVSFGVSSVPVHKNGSSVSMVFDISYSMTANDAPGGLTRLEAALSYAEKLLERMKECSVSVVIAKGDGIILIPQTEDFETIRTTLNNLSPSMMSASGSSLGKGIRASLRSFPENVSRFNNIWLFTDGDETDGLLGSAIVDSLKSNVNITLIGFGSEREMEITAGDGKTRVHTALRANEMKETVSYAIKKAGLRVDSRSIFATYVDASQAGSALTILKPLSSAKSDSDAVIMELQHVYQRSIFLVLAIISFVLAIIFSECDIYGMKKKIKKARSLKAKTSLLCLFTLFFTSCTADYSGAKQILQSTWAWHQQNYRSAISGFLKARESASESDNTILEQYALYGLASTYMMQGENTAAFSRFNQILPDAPQNLRFAACYNAGIIAHREGDFNKAAEQFKNALLINPSSIDAKINLEISLRQYEEKQTQSPSAQSSTSITQSKEKSSTVEDAVFNQIRENEQNQWKNQQSKQSDNSVIDY